MLHVHPWQEAANSPFTILTEKGSLLQRAFFFIKHCVKFAKFQWLIVPIIRGNTPPLKRKIL